MKISKSSIFFRLIIASLLLTYHAHSSFSFCNPDNYEGCGETVRSFCYGLDKFCCERPRWCLNPCFPVWCPKEEDHSQAVNYENANSLVSEAIERNEHFTTNKAEEKELSTTTKGGDAEAKDGDVIAGDAIVEKGKAQGGDAKTEVGFSTGGNAITSFGTAIGGNAKTIDGDAIGGNAISGNLEHAGKALELLNKFKKK